MIMPLYQSNYAKPMNDIDKILVSFRLICATKIQKYNNICHFNFFIDINSKFMCLNICFTNIILFVITDVCTEVRK